MRNLQGPWWALILLKLMPFLFRRCPEGSYHWVTATTCSCSGKARSWREPWFWWHVVNDNRDKFDRKGSPWRQGRLYAHFGRATWHFEWSFRTKSCRLMADVGGCENDLTISVAFPPVALYLGVEGLVPYRWLPRDWEQETGLTVHGGALWGYLWHNSQSWHQGPGSWYRWSKFHFDPMDRFFGDMKYSKRELRTERVEVPMPEGVYPATVNLYESTWKRPRWPFAVRMIRADIKPDTPIPFPGKGENSWDCGEDAVHELTTQADTPLKAVVALVESVLRSRERNGGRNWRPSTKTA